MTRVAKTIAMPDARTAWSFMNAPSRRLLRSGSSDRTMAEARRTDPEMISESSLLPAPGVTGRNAVIPHRAGGDSGERGHGPAHLPREQPGGDADIRERAKAADQRERSQAGQPPP